MPGWPVYLLVSFLFYGCKCWETQKTAYVIGCFKDRVTWLDHYLGGLLLDMDAGGSICRFHGHLFPQHTFLLIHSILFQRKPGLEI
ncbi:hypothetical protein Peur_011262 [Populus x canadensis]